MFIVRVIPIARGIFTNHLTFFSRENIPEGMVVTTTVRGRTIPALVIESKDVREEKLDLRSAGFALKKISAKAKPKRILTSAFINATKDAALWHGVHESVMFAALTSTTLFNASAKLESAEDFPEKETGAHEPGVRADLLVLQAEKEERVRTYRNLARESFARGESVMIIVPTVIEAEQMEQNLKRGIEEHVLLFTSEITKKKLIENWNSSVTNKKPVLIIGTAFALSIPRGDIGTIVVERESARGYRGFSRPHVDVRRCAESLCRRMGIRFILADFPLRIETRYRVDAHEMDELARSQARPSTRANVQIVDTRKKEITLEQTSKTKPKRTFATLTDETKEKIGHEIQRGGRAIVFAARRGIAPLTVCNDCGTPVTDPDTGVPMILHKTENGNVFMSHRSGATLPSETPCKTCGGWNLVTLGVGVERVESELAKTFPNSPLITFTKDSAPTHKTAKKLAEEFFSTEGSILVGTERMLPYLKESVAIAVVASVDSMLSITAWRAHEHTLSILFYLQEHAELEFIVETRKPESEVMKAFMSGNPADFYRADISEREQYGYPPFTTFLGLLWKGTKAQVEKKSLYITELFSDTDLVGPLSPVAIGKSEWQARAVIRVERKKWPDTLLAERLRALPPDIEVTVDPDEIV
ncbi:MAG: hypothetical protein V4449_03530 [Patescibacteria group bacterium]